MKEKALNCFLIKKKNKKLPARAGAGWEADLLGNCCGIQVKSDKEQGGGERMEDLGGEGAELQGLAG